MTEIQVTFSENVKLSTVRLGLVCKKCGHAWAVYLTPNGNLPFGGDVCTDCDHKQKQGAKAKSWTPNKQ